MIREAIAAVTLTAIATVAGAGDTTEKLTGLPELPQCPRLESKNKGSISYNLLKDRYAFTAKGMALLVFPVNLKGTIGDGRIDFSIESPERQVTGQLSAEGVDAVYAGAPNPVRWKGFFDGIAGNICEFEYVGERWKTNFNMGFWFSTPKREKWDLKLEVDDWRLKDFKMKLEIEFPTSTPYYAP
ncbi:hypothetical protein GOV07_01675 [Candidatus Woesearchaeota archaeon]|nr:hypothetical protein [Candidatus Woesearchaeota archaeon]